MRRTNTFAVRPRSEEDEQLFRELLDASASLWNALNYERRQNFFAGENVWDTADYRKQYPQGGTGASEGRRDARAFINGTRSRVQ